MANPSIIANSLNPKRYDQLLRQLFITNNAVVSSVAIAVSINDKLLTSSYHNNVFDREPS